MEEQHNEQENQPELTLSELNESIQKLRANRDLILTEKKAAKRATDAMKAEYDTLNGNYVTMSEQFRTHLKQTAMNNLLAKVDIEDEAMEFMNYKLAKHIQVTNENDTHGFSFVDQEGKAIEFNDLVRAIKDDPKYAPFVIRRASGGATGWAGASRAFESTPKQNPNQFGFGKKIGK